LIVKKLEILSGRFGVSNYFSNAMYTSSLKQIVINENHATVDVAMVGSNMQTKK